jgi:nucleotide-binding universal stress UspA family protein
MIVIGIDGSEGSALALRFAREEGRLRGEPLQAVTAWELPVPVYAGGFIAPSVTSDDVEKAAREVAEKQLVEVLGADGGERPELVVREGSAAGVLVDAAKQATMLVVGSRGHGGFTGLLLGSVSQQCAHHASCPVTIVPASAGRDA